MARTTVMPTAGGGTLGRKIMAALVVLAILAMVIHDPAGSAHTVVAVFHWSGGVIDALSRFGQAVQGR